MAQTQEETTTRASNDAYTGMLAISLIALIAGCALLYLDYSQYPDKAPATPKAPPPQMVPAAQPPAGQPAPPAGQPAPVPMPMANPVEAK